MDEGLSVGLKIVFEGTTDKFISDKTLRRNITIFT